MSLPRCLFCRKKCFPCFQIGVPLKCQTEGGLPQSLQHSRETSKWPQFQKCDIGSRYVTWLYFHPDSKYSKHNTIRHLGLGDQRKRVCFFCLLEINMKMIGEILYHNINSYKNVMYVTF